MQKKTLKKYIYCFVFIVCIISNIVCSHIFQTAYSKTAQFFKNNIILIKTNPTQFIKNASILISLGISGLIIKQIISSALSLYKSYFHFLNILPPDVQENISKIQDEISNIKTTLIPENVPLDIKVKKFLSLNGFSFKSSSFFEKVFVDKNPNPYALSPQEQENNVKKYKIIQHYWEDVIQKIKNNSLPIELKNKIEKQLNEFNEKNGDIMLKLNAISYNIINKINVDEFKAIENTKIDEYALPQKEAAPLNFDDEIDKKIAFKVNNGITGELFKYLTSKYWQDFGIKKLGGRGANIIKQQAFNKVIQKLKDKKDTISDHLTSLENLQNLQTNIIEITKNMIQTVYGTDEETKFESTIKSLSSDAIQKKEPQKNEVNKTETNTENALNNDVKKQIQTIHSKDQNLIIEKESFNEERQKNSNEAKIEHQDYGHMPVELFFF